MEKNCTNCKYHCPVSGNFYSGQYSGFCNHEKHKGRLASKDTFCSEYEEREDLQYTNDLIQEVLLGIKCCTDKASGGCTECPFARYKCTCQQDLMFAAGELIEKQLLKIEDLERDVSGYTANQEV